MKPLKLTEQHKEKLLEMCKVLFPEYEITIHGSNIYINITEHIHWFEFCYTELAYKIFSNKELNFSKKADHLNKFYTEILISWKNHPIDYLYSEFKKLKLN